MYYTDFSLEAYCRLNNYIEYTTFFAATFSCPLASQSNGEHFPALLVCLCLPGGPVAIILLTTPGDPGKYQLK